MKVFADSNSFRQIKLLSFILFVSRFINSGCSDKYWFNGSNSNHSLKNWHKSLAGLVSTATCKPQFSIQAKTIPSFVLDLSLKSGDKIFQMKTIPSFVFHLSLKSWHKCVRGFVSPGAPQQPGLLANASCVFRRRHNHNHMRKSFLPHISGKIWYGHTLV